MKLHPVDLFLLSCTCLLLCVAAPVRADIRPEAEALVNWKASLAGAGVSLGSWSLANSTKLCWWTHITCNSAKHITKLDLDGARLNGTLDELNFSAFPYLKKLIMSDNGLYGTIPARIGNLTSLVVLQITRNPYLRGAIPRSIGQLKHLTILEMVGLELDGTLPEEIGNLTNLEELHLNSVSLSGSIPLTIGMLVKLRFLWLERSNLTGSIPMEIGNMTELQDMDLSENYLEGQLPSTISHLRKLQVLHLFGNQLGGYMGPELGNSTLQDVDVASNNFSGLFPSSICGGKALRALNAGYNGFTGIDLQTLRFVDFTANNIVADLKGCFGEHPRVLQIMLFSQNQLYGTLLTDWGEVFICNYTRLYLIDLSNNTLHGGLSKCFWGMPNLGFMDLSNNSFNGIVPLSRTCAGSLSNLLLANNLLEGTFPLGLKKCKNLITLC